MATAAALLFAAACAADTVTAPADGAPGIRSAAVHMAVPQTVTVCKDAHSPPGTYDFVVNAVTGRIDDHDVGLHSFSLHVPEGAVHNVCTVVYTRTYSEDPHFDHQAWVTVTELERHGTQLDAVHVTTDGLPGVVDLPHHQATLFVSAFHSSHAVFVGALHLPETNDPGGDVD